MNRNPRPSTGANVAFGLVLIGLGSMFLLDHLDIIGFGQLVRMYWPLGFVILGVPQLFDRRSLGTGFWMVGFGAWLQVARAHLFGLSYGTAWPLLVIVAGASITISAVIDGVKGQRDGAPSAQ